MWARVSNASNIAYWLIISRNVVKDYYYRNDIDQRILSKEDLEELIQTLDRIIEILDKNQSKFNIILNLINLINKTKGKNN